MLNLYQMVIVLLLALSYVHLKLKRLGASGQWLINDLEFFKKHTKLIENKSYKRSFCYTTAHGWEILRL